MNIDNITDISRKDVLSALGLAPRLRDYIWPAIGLFSTGVLLGAGVALLLTPKSGAKLRAELRDEFRSRVDNIERKLGVKSHEEQEKQDQAGAEQSEAAAEQQREPRAA